MLCWTLYLFGKGDKNKAVSKVNTNTKAGCAVTKLGEVILLFVTSQRADFQAVPTYFVKSGAS